TAGLMRARRRPATGAPLARTSPAGSPGSGDWRYLLRLPLVLRSLGGVRRPSPLGLARARDGETALAWAAACLSAASPMPERGTAPPSPARAAAGGADCAAGEAASPYAIALSSTSACWATVSV